MGATERTVFSSNLTAAIAEVSSQLDLLSQSAPALDLRQDLDFGQWSRLVLALKAEGTTLMHRETRWMFLVGDAVNFGERRFGDMAKDFLNEVGLSYNQVAKYASVARRVPAEVRQVTLTLEHHRRVAHLSPPYQASWLARAEEERLTAGQLHEAMRIAAASPTVGVRKFGPPLNFHELRYEPVGEQGVVFLFGMVARELGFLVEGVATACPDCVGKRRVKGGRYEHVRIEFEFKSSGFRNHKHRPQDCDVLVCWEHNWRDCPVEVIELRRAIKELDPTLRL